MNERFGYDDAARARELVCDAVRATGLNPDDIKEGVVIGSGLAGFTRDYMKQGTKEDDVPVVIPFSEILSKIDIPDIEARVQGHARQLVIGPLKGTAESRLVIAQNGREHTYEGVSTKRSTFWLRVMQLLGVETLLGSNATGILTPSTLTPPALVLIHSDQDSGSDNPLTGVNDPRFFPRFPHMGDLYPAATRAVVRTAAAREGIEIKGVLLNLMC